LDFVPRPTKEKPGIIAGLSLPAVEKLLLDVVVLLVVVFRHRASRNRHPRYYGKRKYREHQLPKFHPRIPLSYPPVSRPPMDS